MNVEVLRLRAVPGGDAGRLAVFAAAAGQATDDALAIAGALLALARRPPAGNADVRLVVGQVAALLAPGMAARGGSVAVADGGTRTGASTHARAASDAVRLAVASLLLAATDDPTAAIRCIFDAERAVTLRLDAPPARAPDPEDVAAFVAAGIAWNPVTWVLTFPSA